MVKHDNNTQKILNLCKKQTNIYQISKEINMAYKNVLNRLKNLEEEGYLKKSKVKNPNKINSELTIYRLTSGGKRLKEELDAVEKGVKIVKFNFNIKDLHWSYPTHKGVLAKPYGILKKSKKS